MLRQEPINFSSYQLTSWWDMKPFPVADFLQLVRTLAEPLGDPEAAKTPLSEEARKATVGGINTIIKQCEECDLPLSADQLRRTRKRVEEGCTNADMEPLIQELMNRIEDESKRLVVMAIEPEHVKYIVAGEFFDPTEPSAAKVSVQFSSAAEDISEAGKCLACGRGTACVMHLNRVMEVGLGALAGAVGVGPQNDWGKYLDKIDKELQHRLTTSGARTTDEQFYSEVHITFDGVRRAWRNPTMHVDKTYTVEHAEEIMIATRSFMRHLATKLHD